MFSGGRSTELRGNLEYFAASIQKKISWNISFIENISYIFPKKNFLYFVMNAD